MALISHTSNEFVVLFDQNVQNKAREIYQAIPGSLIKYLHKREIVKKVSFRQDFKAAQVQMGTKKNVNFVDFEQALRGTIDQRFTAHGVTEIRAEELSAAISARYQNQTPSRPDPGKTVSAIIKFNQTLIKKEGEFWTNVNAYVYFFIEEECENNWYATDKRKFNYDLTIDLSGIAINKDKAIGFSQMVMKTPVKQAIEHLEEKYALTWDEI